MEVALRAVPITALGVIVLINAANIGSRAVFHADMEWIQEASIIGAMVIYFYAIALIGKGNADIRMDFFVRVPTCCCTRPDWSAIRRRRRKRRGDGCCR